jgi:hypothetical protein
VRRTGLVHRGNSPPVDARASSLGCVLIPDEAPYCTLENEGAFAR